MAAQSLYQALQALPDPRRAQGKRYELALILPLLLLAKLAGQKTLSGATEWIRHRAAALREHFGFQRSTMPCQMTYCNVLAAIDAKQLDDLLAALGSAKSLWRGTQSPPHAARPRRSRTIGH